MTARDDLSKVLRAPLPPGIEALDEADLARLTEVLRSAAAAQEEALEAATEHGLSFVPRAVRGAVRKLVLG